MLFSLISLFLSAFIAATLFPAASEALMVALIIEDHVPVWLLVMFASVGNTLGSLLNWWLGGQIERFHDRSWFPVKANALARAKQRFHDYGEWSLLLSWVPIIGDPLTLVAGVLGMPWQRFLLFVAIAKTGRYCVVAAMTVGAA